MEVYILEKEIYEKLNDIKDLEDRVLLKGILNSVFSALENYTEERFNALFIAFFALINALRVSALLSTVIAEVLCVAVKDC